ncbi:hypothetical protein EJ06DRAFT_556620 [Trichodelitschia bisporula]|uniref:Uncharacterized protein n=1 Tax=Trichodelitschia bisporula TaxID=703511 RepID=A0A6G1HWS2_9PEZI|nr:hypothetical protein EJ06DRAFT_556620 [Trichodelitschia bisporula]
MASPKEPQQAPSSSSKGYDLIDRGSRAPSPLGTTLFTVLRALDPLLQYQILRHGLGSGFLHRMGLKARLPGFVLQTGIPPLDGLGLSPHRLLLLAMATGGSLKQIYWLLGTSYESFGPGAALALVAYNTAFNTVNNLIFTLPGLSAALPGELATAPAVALGVVLYVVGMGVEVVSEQQRYNFKKKPENKGKVFTGGLFRLSRHANYAGFTLWRTGYCLAAGGWIWGATAFAYLFALFALSSIPILDDYCGKKYGKSWKAFKEKTPYRLFPYIY